MREIKRIIIHCSDSMFGDRSVIDSWHRAKTYIDHKGVVRHWQGIGYHYVIGNGYPAPGGVWHSVCNGKVEEGRPESHQGAHVKGENRDTIGICLIGKHQFTQKQLFVSLPELLTKIMRKYNLVVADIYGHKELDGGKTCPNLDMNLYREFLRSYNGK